MLHGCQSFSKVDQTHNTADIAEVVNLALDVQCPADSHSLLLWRALQQYMPRLSLLRCPGESTLLTRRQHVTMTHMSAPIYEIPSSRLGAGGTSIITRIDAHLVGEDLAGVLGNGNEDTH